MTYRLVGTSEMDDAFGPHGSSATLLAIKAGGRTLKNALRYPRLSCSLLAPVRNRVYGYRTEQSRLERNVRTVSLFPDSASISSNPNSVKTRFQSR